MNKYIKRPLEIEAVKFWYNADEIMEWVEENSGEAIRTDYNEIHIKTLEGTMSLQHGDWLIKGIEGEFYPCRFDIFEKTYEEVVKDES